MSGAPPAFLNALMQRQGQGGPPPMPPSAAPGMPAGMPQGAPGQGGQQLPPEFIKFLLMMLMQKMQQGQGPGMPAPGLAGPQAGPSTDLPPGA